VSDDPRGEVLRLGIMLAIGLFGLALYVFAYLPAAWDECTRIHPAWYCAGELGRK